jgi:prepilin-type N-terminal cleavage/methylation domain-containing protein
MELTMRYNRGFTIIELLVVLVLTSVISLYAVTSFNKTIAKNELQKYTQELLKQLSACRPLAMKNDCKVFVTFSSALCSIYLDKDNDGVMQQSERYLSWSIPAPVSVGLPSVSPPGSAPPNATLPLAGKVASGAWATAFVVDDDAMGTMNTGSVYLFSSRQPNVAYCITISTLIQNIKLYLWNGASWTAL